MDSFQRLRISRQALLRLQSAHAGTIQAARLQAIRPSPLLHLQRRNASSAKDPKHTSLEQPDKFRPPSHPSRLVKSRSRGSTYNGAYNQSSTAQERDAQRHKKYPHMFPNEGTIAHRFLTNRSLHILITMAVLLFLAGVTWIQTFVKTSPFGHLMPPLSSLFGQPLQFFQDVTSTLKLDQDYNTEKVEFERARNILDAQKRRIYRRAHGMEDLDRDEDQGVDVRGIVPWDDGLTKREREAGGISANRIKLITTMKVTDDDKEKMSRVREKVEMNAAAAAIKTDEFIMRREAELGLSPEDDRAVAARNARQGQGKGMTGNREMALPESVTKQQQYQRQQQQPEKPQEEQPERRRKLWFGIW